MTLQRLSSGLVKYKNKTLTAIIEAIESKLGETVSITDFGAKCDGITDDTAAIHAALNSNYKKITMPEGTIVVSNLIFPTKSGYSLVGTGSGLTVIKATGTGIAMSLDAFPDPEDNMQPFMYNVNLKGFSLIGDAYTIGIDAQGVARSQWEDIRVNGSTKAADSIGYRFSGCHLNRFTSIFTSYGDGDVPYTGIILRAGTRAHVSVGGCSNNYFSHIYPEGNSIGLQLAANGADQNVFDIGAPEACKVYGQVVGQGCRYNKFIGMGYENKNATSASVADGGLYSSYESCYSDTLFRVDAQARGLSIVKGYFDGISIQKGAISTEIKDITVGTWNLVGKVLADLGTDTKVLNVFNGRTNKYLPPSSTRTAVTVSGSPFTWTNELHSPVKVLLYGGAVTKVSVGQPNETETSYDNWEEPKPLPASFGGEARGIYILMPRQRIEISHTNAPTMNVMPLRFMQ